MKKALGQMKQIIFSGLGRSVGSYLIVFLVPFLIVSGIWYKTSTDSINSQVELSSRNHLLQLKSSFENNLLQLNDLSHQIPHDVKLTLQMLKHPYYTLEGQQSLQKHRLEGSIVDDVFLMYNEQPDSLFSADGWLDTKLFFKPLTKKTYSSQELSGFLKTDVPKLINLSSQFTDQSNRLYYLVPLQNADQVTYGTVIYAIKDSSVQKLLDESTFDDESANFILNSKNQLLSSPGSNQYVSYMSQAKKAAKIQNNGQLTIKGNRYLTQTLSNPDLGLTYVSLVNPDQALQNINQVQKKFMFFILGTLLFGGVLVFLIGRSNYRPIQRLEKLMAEYDEEDESLGDKKPLQVHERLAGFLSENKELHEEIKKQTPHAREQVLRKLVGGRIKDEAQLTMLLEAVHVQLKGKQYFTMTISTREKGLNEFSPLHDILMEYLQMVRGTGFVGYATEILSTQVIAILIAYDDPTQLKRITEAFYNDIFDLVGISPTIAVGTPVNSLVEMNRSFIESLAALEHSFTIKDQAIVYYDELREEPKTTGISYPESQQMKLIQSLTQGDFEVASETIHWLVEYGIQQQGSVNSQRIYGFYLVNILNKFASGVESEAAIASAEGAADFQSLYDLEPQLLQIAESLCALVQATPQNQESQLKQDLFAFINEHYASSQLSLEMVAEQFQLSVSYLSRFIKKESGKTFSKYVQDLRMEKIKQALIETDRPIKDIIREAGYYDVSNYTRKFRTLVGVTPGQFRTLNKH
ncbi:helix-turn-helix domain-containing protein [Enterococcus diestrammenae]|uniref:helix-turn-helix domain-containing protein n=1 Tax=Enterococcus diestrammenae TaxID=1155073 RepID=UPI0022E504EB|nr:helix-turn-helix domain-containing protein [Enterococcus diestrammenae]